MISFVIGETECWKNDDHSRTQVPESSFMVHTSLQSYLKGVS